MRREVKRSWGSGKSWGAIDYNFKLISWGIYWSQSSFILRLISTIYDWPHFFFLYKYFPIRYCQNISSYQNKLNLVGRHLPVNYSAAKESVASGGCEAWKLLWRLKLQASNFVQKNSTSFTKILYWRKDEKIDLQKIWLISPQKLV